MLLHLHSLVGVGPGRNAGNSNLHDLKKRHPDTHTFEKRVDSIHAILIKKVSAREKRMCALFFAHDDALFPGLVCHPMAPKGVNAQPGTIKNIEYARIHHVYFSLSFFPSYLHPNSLRAPPQAKARTQHAEESPIGLYVSLASPCSVFGELLPHSLPTRKLPARRKVLPTCTMPRHGGQP